MSDDSEFHTSDAATGKECRSTALNRKGSTSSCYDDGDRAKSAATG